MRKITFAFLLLVAMGGRAFAEGPALPTDWNTYSYSGFHYSFDSPFSMEPVEKNYKPGYLMSIPKKDSDPSNFKMLVGATTLKELFHNQNLSFKKVPDAMFNMMVEVKTMKRWKSNNRWFSLPGKVPACISRASGITPKGRKDEYMLLSVDREGDLWFVLIAYPYGDQERFKMASRIIHSFKSLEE